MRDFFGLNNLVAGHSYKFRPACNSGFYCFMYSYKNYSTISKYSRTSEIPTVPSEQCPDLRISFSITCEAGA